MAWLITGFINGFHSIPYFTWEFGQCVSKFHLQSLGISILFSHYQTLGSGELKLSSLQIHLRLQICQSEMKLKRHKIWQGSSIRAVWMKTWSAGWWQHRQAYLSSGLIFKVKPYHLEVTNHKHVRTSNQLMAETMSIIPELYTFQCFCWGKNV